MLFSRLALVFVLCFSSAASWAAQTWSEGDLARIAQRDPRAIFYFVSRGMPLSQPGITNISQVARASGYRVYFVSDWADRVATVGRTPIPVGARTGALSQIGTYLHFPSMLVYRQGKLCGPPIAGYKSLQGYQRILARLDRDCARLPGLAQLTNRPSRPQPEQGFLIRQTPVPRETRFFFKAVDETWVTYHDGGAYLSSTGATARSTSSRARSTPCPRPTGSG
jgi:hypothetical protein